MKRPWTAGLLLTGIAAALSAGCGDDQSPKVGLQMVSIWNGDPLSVGDVGYQMQVYVSWVDRGQDCFKLSSNLLVQVNDFQAVPSFQGDCESTAELAFGPFLTDVPVTVQLKDGGKTLGQAQFDRLFPGMGLQLLSPAGGQVRAGDPMTFSLPAAPVLGTTVEVRFYWLDTPASVPPFYSIVSGTVGTDGQTVQIMAPALTGHAQVVTFGPFPEGAGEQLSCTGFQFCGVQTDTSFQGPVPVEVVP